MKESKLFGVLCSQCSFSSYRYFLSLFKLHKQKRWGFDENIKFPSCLERVVLPLWVFARLAGRKRQSRRNINLCFCFYGPQNGDWCAYSPSLTNRTKCILSEMELPISRNPLFHPVRLAASPYLIMSWILKTLLRISSHSACVSLGLHEILMRQSHKSLFTESRDAPQFAFANHDCIISWHTEIWISQWLGRELH